MRFTYRPASRAPGDAFLIDRVLNGQAILVTHNVRDFRRASKKRGFREFLPTEFIMILEADET